MFQAALGLYGREPRPSERLNKVNQAFELDGQLLRQLCQCGGVPNSAL
jgi:hypothetical protein